MYRFMNHIPESFIGSGFFIIFRLLHSQCLIEEEIKLCLRRGWIYEELGLLGVIKRKKILSRYAV